MSVRYSGDAEIRMSYGPVWIVAVERGRHRSDRQAFTKPERAQGERGRLLAMGIQPTRVRIFTEMGYRGAIADPYLHFDDIVPVEPRFTPDPTSSDAYDDAARRLATNAQQWARDRPLPRHIRRRRPFQFELDSRGRVSLRRGYQAPCPLK
jgi:hypothetical protein